jgi:ABC-type dipeptide/oligopeptide/nickel transport system permease component
MGRYAARRLLVTVPVVWAAISLLFLLFFVIPGDPVELIAGSGGARAVTESVRENIEARYGLDDPWYAQYAAYWSRTLTGDLGESYASRRSVSSILSDTFTASARLALWAILFEVLIGIAAGVLSAVRRYSFGDALTTVTTAAISALPVFVLGYLLQHAFGIVPEQSGWPDWLRLPVQGIGPNTWTFFFVPTGEQWRYLLLPAITLASVATAIVARLTRTTMVEVGTADYVRTARAKGLSQRRVVLRHGLRNALIPVVTLVGLNLADLIGSAILTETVFNWPGMGSSIAEAIARRDAPVVLGGTLVLVVIYVLVNLLVDLSYGILDPRIRHGSRP